MEIISIVQISVKEWNWNISSNFFLLLLIHRSTCRFLGLCNQTFHFLPIVEKFHPKRIEFLIFLPHKISANPLEPPSIERLSWRCRIFSSFLFRNGKFLCSKMIPVATCVGMNQEKEGKFGKLITFHSSLEITLVAANFLFSSLFILITLWIFNRFFTA